VRRDLEASEQEYEERLVQARRREEALRRAAKGRVTKRLVSPLFKNYPHQLHNWIYFRPFFQKLAQGDRDPSENDADDDDRFLPEDQASTSNEEEIHISPELRALMAK
jgi:chromosome transmission fidelity protein 1